MTLRVGDQLTKMTEEHNAQLTKATQECNAGLPADAAKFQKQK